MTPGARYLASVQGAQRAEKNTKGWATIAYHQLKKRKNDYRKLSSKGVLLKKCFWGLREGFLSTRGSASFWGSGGQSSRMYILVQR